jgi:Tfp pilus assembly protein PilF
MTMHFGIFRGAVLMAAIGMGGCATFFEPAATTEGPDDTKQAELAMTRAEAALRQGELDRALFEYVNVLSLDEDKADAHYMVGVIHFLKGNLDLAMRAFQKTLSIAKDHAGALEGIGLVLLRDKKPEEAKAYLEKALAADEHRWRAHNGLGVIADLNHDYAAAEEHYQAALRERPETPMLLTNLGYSKYAAGDWAGAQSYFERALAINPRHEKAWSNLGLLHVRRGSYGKAMDAFTRIMPESRASNSVGYLCLMDGKYLQAEEYFVEAIKQSPAYYAEAHDNLQKAKALAYQSAGPEFRDGGLECR